MRTPAKRVVVIEVEHVYLRRVWAPRPEALVPIIFKPHKGPLASYIHAVQRKNITFSANRNRAIVNDHLRSVYRQKILLI